MSTLVVFYSHSGKTRTLATQRAQELGADIEEVLQTRPFTRLSVWFRGAPKAMGRKSVDIQPLKADLNAYDLISIWMPIWGGHPAPVFNSLIALLPEGKRVELTMVSDGGHSQKSAGGTRALVTARHCEVVEYTDVKS